MDSNINIELWAKQLGFEGAFDPNFHESWIKLVPPSARSIWRHVISHVLPANKASYIHKLCLLYKLELQEKINHGVKLQANVQSLKDYEKFMQINNAETNLAYLNGQIDSVRNEIKELWSKLNANCIKARENEKKEDEKLIKSKLIEIKIKSVNEEIDGLKKMHDIVNNFSKARIAMITDQKNNQWDKETVKFCKQLPEGHEIDKLYEYLDSLLQINLKGEIDNKREQKDKVLQEMKQIFINKFLEADIHRKNYESLIDKTNILREEIIQKFKEHHNIENQSEKFNNIFGLTIQEIFDAAELTALTQLENSWRVEGNCKTEQYIALKKQISSLEDQRETKLKSIATYMSGQKKLVQFCINAQKSIKTEPKMIISKLKTNYESLMEEIQNLNILIKEVEVFLKIPALVNAFKDRILHASNSYMFDCERKLETYSELFSGLKFELPNANKNAVKDISEIKDYEMKLESKLRNFSENITKIVQEIERLKVAITVNMEFWETQPLAEGSSSCSEDYFQWRERCKEAFKNKKIYNSVDQD